jgi:hypothetical protein
MNDALYDKFIRVPKPHHEDIQVTNKAQLILTLGCMVSLFFLCSGDERIQKYRVRKLESLVYNEPTAVAKELRNSECHLLVTVLLAVQLSLYNTLLLCLQTANRKRNMAGAALIRIYPPGGQ